MKNVAVIKIGGALLENPEGAAARILEAGADRFTVIHGGGVQITRMLDRMGVQSHFIDGLRVTDEVTLQAVAAALLGEVHTALAAALQRAGVPAVGVVGVIRAERKQGPWGLVGTNLKADGAVLKSLMDQQRVPVVPTLAFGDASLLNVNGDETAAAAALAVGAERLIFLTDVEGVRSADGTVISHAPDAASLADAPFVTGGMKPKLRAVAAALAGGVARVTVGRTTFGRQI